jgi:HD-GYP domain-containing protein (c-di-GMP phosphodiesterase class II)
MTADRPHRAALDAADAMAQLELGAGTQFDPEVVRAFREVFAARSPDRFNSTAGAPA